MIAATETITKPDQRPEDVLITEETSRRQVNALCIQCRFPQRYRVEFSDHPPSEKIE